MSGRPAATGMSAASPVGEIAPGCRMRALAAAPSEGVLAEAEETEEQPQT